MSGENALFPPKDKENFSWGYQSFDPAFLRFIADFRMFSVFCLRNFKHHG